MMNGFGLRADTNRMEGDNLERWSKLIGTGKKNNSLKAMMS